MDKAAVQTPAQSDRAAPLAMDPEQFRALGHALVDRLAAFQAGLAERPVTPAESPAAIRAALGPGSLPEHGAEAATLLDEAATLLIEHSLFNAHPRFWGYITAPPAPIGVLGDLLAAAVNPNVGSFVLAPLATELEAQTVRWLAELVGYPQDAGGLLVSGGAMANYIGFLAARKTKAPGDVRADGIAGGAGRLRVYASSQTHTWIEKAADMFGLGTSAVRWIAADDQQRIQLPALHATIQADRARGDLPFLVVGAAGSVGTGAVDPLPELAALCRDEDLWFHVDGAYGGFAAALLDSDERAEVPEALRGLREADSLAMDPHKWLYAPLEAGCVLVRDAQALRDTFSYHPVYYHLNDMGDHPLNFVDYGPQNSRGFRALKVWLALRQVGRAGHIRMIADDIRLSREMARRVTAEPELQALTQSLSIATFRYVPAGLTSGAPEVEAYLNELNAQLMARLHQSGEVFVTNADLGGTFALRACIVNYHTSPADVAALPGIVVRAGRELDAALRPDALAGNRP